MAELPRHLLRGGGHWRAPFACDPSASRGRLHAEPDDPLRSPFQRDRDRIIHSEAFRRLRHKTQVFIRHDSGEGGADHFRTRLTHTLEVAQVARSLARPLGLDEDLTEALALAHDLGHPPFGHAGERALDEALSGHGGFDHNDQSLRVVTTLERRYPQFDGLNLCVETLEGLVKHNGPLAPADPDFRPSAVLLAVQAEADLRLDLFAPLEAQVAAISDDIAYDSHDLEDGLRAGLLTLEALEDTPLAGPILAAIDREFPRLDPRRRTHELVRRLISGMIADVLAETARQIADSGVESPDEVRMAGRTLARFSPAMAGDEKELKRFLFGHLYRSETVLRPVRAGEAIVAALFAAYSEDTARLPVEWRSGLRRDDPAAVARRAADYIAGMTDRYALSEHRRLFDDTPELG